ncbi:MAG: hypothetical protein EHM55_06090 [Acidobacteria bacterium]|nr:MAG: hypothetical protein EHM55_06090 [Acidobacteriota bacterium]
MFVPALWSAGPFLGMLGCVQLGYRIGHRGGADKKDATDAFQAIEAAIFALLGLLLGFAFAGAMTRLDARRQLIIHEASAIGTAYLRLDLAPVSEQPALRHLFRSYLEARVRT